MNCPSTPHVQAIHAYCDGSVNGRRSGCGLFIHDYIFAIHYTDTEVSRQFPTHMSSTRPELYAVLEVLHIVAPFHKNVYFFIDSQAVMYALQPTSPMDCDLVNKCLDLIHALEGAGATGNLWAKGDTFSGTSYLKAHPLGNRCSE
ncbi:hypothetical protein E2C01_006285 [Portunus trituberculatus]|uniref:Uncharacterized protein n=1 Tax=Portunus trituberculatus TaxID=210409 RepID=A0A5B7CUP3_PORTR|nr:hypothetical protein [Portunus trituberculatus]